MYVVKDDFKTSIKEAELNELAGSNLTNAIKIAEAEAFSYLRRIYDIKEALKANGDERDLHLVYIIVCIAIYNLSKLTDMNNIPEQREQSYLRAIEWLKGASTGKFDLTIPKLKEEGGDIGIIQYNENNLINLDKL